MPPILSARRFSAAILCCLTAFHIISAAAAEASIRSRYVEPYPLVASKKGLQVEMVDDAIELGVKHAALNLNLSQLAAPVGADSALDWEEKGRRFQFQRGYVEHLDREIKTLSDRGILVNLIILAYASGNPAQDAVLLHPNYSTNAPNRLGNFNTVTADGRAWFSACLGFMAERWSRPDRSKGRVCGYIIGNEVNSHWFWANMGPVTMEAFADDYLRTTRMAFEAVRRQSSWARVYLSMEHHWTIKYPPAEPTQAFAGRPFLEYFARRASEAGGFEWHLAFHPYPENLFEPRFWNDKSATETVDTPRITFKNLQVLTEFMQRPEMLYAGKPRRIILSEQGFHSPRTEDGERTQAAAYCYAYRKVDRLDGIDSFILHRHVDHPDEGGLNLGLRRRSVDASNPRPPKRIYECFKLADTPQWEDAFRFALPVIGLERWP